jgi:hypothetical protein
MKLHLFKINYEPNQPPFTPHTRSWLYFD